MTQTLQLIYSTLSAARSLRQTPSLERTRRSRLAHSPLRSPDAAVATAAAAAAAVGVIALAAAATRFLCGSAAVNDSSMETRVAPAAQPAAGLLAAPAAPATVAATLLSSVPQPLRSIP